MTQRQVLAILKTGVNVFVTGEPGSGKTHVVNEYIRYLKQSKVRVAVTASTGIAATHLGGVTVHSWSGVGIRKTLSGYELDSIAANERTARRVAQATVLIIDEISMLDGAVLNCVDQICRTVKQRPEPFGGMQVVFVGDFFQLPPVTREGEETAQFAFESPVWRRVNPIVCYISEQYRQEDRTWLDVLLALRRNTVEQEHREHLDSRCVSPPREEGLEVTRLFSHNADVDRMNNKKLRSIPGTPKAFTMSSEGKKPLVDQLQRGCLSPQRLVLKEGALVMFTKNSPRGAFVNGTLGAVVGFDELRGYPIVETKRGVEIIAKPMDWTIEDDGRVIACIRQVPLRLAWAMTVHKSQGMSLDTSFIDLRSAFVAGQGYVALSRVRSLEGLYLAGYNEMSLVVNEEVAVRDVEFRRQSAQAMRAFAELSRTEMRTLQKNFVRAMGGKPQKERSTAREEQRKAYSVAAIRSTHPNAYRGWRKQEDATLVRHYRGGMSIKRISHLLGRQPGAIRSRLQRIGEK